MSAPIPGFPSGGGGNPITGAGKGPGFKDVKNDLIAELKLSHHVGGISKLKCEQQKHQEEIEKEQYQKFLSQFTMETFFEKVPSHDPSGVEIPKWKREMMAKKAAEKAKKEAIQRKAKEEEDLRMAAMPVWKKQLIEKKMEDPKRQHRPSVSESSEHSSQAELTMEFSISPAPPSSIPTTNQNSSQFDQEISVNSPQSQNQTEPTKIGPYMSNDIAAENAADAPWRGILRKTESKINLNE